MAYDAVVDRISPRFIIDVRGDAVVVPKLLATVPLTSPAAPNSWSASSETVLAWIAPRRWMVIAPMEAEAKLLPAFATPPAGVSAMNVSDAFATFSVSGAGAVDVLAQATPLDVHPAAFSEKGASFTDLFGQGALVLRRGGLFECFVDASYEDYIADRFMRCHAVLGNWFTRFRAGRA